MSRTKAQDTDLRGGGESIGPLRPATSEEEECVRRWVWRQAVLWQKRSKRALWLRSAYYQEVCMALGVMKVGEADHNWHYWNKRRLKYAPSGALFTRLESGEDQDG